MLHSGDLVVGGLTWPEVVNHRPVVFTCKSCSGLQGALKSQDEGVILLGKDPKALPVPLPWFLQPRSHSVLR